MSLDALLSLARGINLIAIRRVFQLGSNPAPLRFGDITNIFDILR